MATQAEIAVLRGTATQVKNESQVGGNTAGRVGGLFEGIVDALPSDEAIEGKISEAVADIQPIVIEGNVDNAPDQEDLTSVNQGGTDVLKFKDKTYAPALFSGLGRVYLRKNMVTPENLGYSVNLLTAEMVAQENTIYHIQYDYDLNGQTITLPAGCVLEFDGGSVKNGGITGNYTKINAGYVKIFESVSISGTWDVKLGHVEWFGGSFQQCLSSFGGIELAKCNDYTITENVIFPASGLIEGNGAVIRAADDLQGTLFTLGYCSKVRNLAIKSQNVINIFDVSGINYEATYTNRLYYSVGIGIVVENVNIVVPSDVSDAGNTPCVKIEYNGGTNNTGFWGIRFTNLNISGRWTYGIKVYAGNNNYITGCTFDNIFAKGCDTFLFVSGLNANSQISNFVFRRVQVQYDSTTNLCASLSRCTDFYFVNCQNWDFPSAPYEIDDNTCGNIVLDNSGKFYSNPNTLFINTGTTLPSKKAVLIGSAIGLGMLSQYVDLSNYSSTNKVPKEVLSSLQTGDYLITYSNAHFKALGINPANIIATTFKDGIFRITHCYARVFVEIFGFDTLTRIYACFKESETGDITWEYDNPVDIFTTAQYNALTSVNAGRIMLANSRIAYTAVNNKDEIRGADGARFTPTIAYSRAGLASLIPATNANYYLNNKHLIDTSTNREVIFYDGIWRDYDGVDITTPRTGPTSARPAASSIYIGFQYFDTTLGRPVFWDGTGWVDSSAIKIVEHGTSDTTYALTPNVFHIWGEVGSLTLTLAAGISGILNEYNFQFNSGSTPTTISLPNTIKWVQPFVPEANKTYQVSIVNGIGVFIGV